MADDADDPTSSLDTAVPALTAQTRPKPSVEPAELRRFDFDGLKNRFVEVRASGYRYTGTLVGADDQDLYLKGVTRWWVLALDRVSEVRLLSETPPDERPARRRGPIPGDPDPSAQDDPEPAAPPDDDEAP
jgi:hypothetical protein